MRRGVVRVLLLAVMMLGVYGIAAAQTGPSIPAIVSFTANVPSVSLSQVEAGQATVTLGWHIVNVTQGQSVALDTYVQNGWISLLNAGETLSPVGTREITLRDPMNFGMPTFRLTLISGRNVIDQRYLTIPFAQTGLQPDITSFTTEVTSVDPAAINSGNARVTVNWTVANRLPTTNLVFDQVLSETESVSAELPRAFLYVPSSGSGPLALVPPVGVNYVELRLSVVDVISGTVYDTATLYVPFTGFEAEVPSAPPETEGDAAPVPVPSPVGQQPIIPPVGGEQPAVGGTTGGPQVNVFTVTPNNASPGSNVTIAWNVANATTVQIQEILADGTPGITYVQLPLLGAISVPLPANATNQVIYRLTAEDDQGGVTMQDVSVIVATG